jgi:lysyl-tRNA synthetase class 2
MTRAGAPWWMHDSHAGRRSLLLTRNRIQAALREWFAGQGFVEVEPAALQVSPGNETHLHALATDLGTTDGRRRRMYLHTSPEFAMKKLLAAGETRIFSFAHVFRNRERSALHAPEFTMLEWYRARRPYDVVMDDCTAILATAARAAGAGDLGFRQRLANPFLPPERLTVAQAFHRHAGIDLLATVAKDGTPDRARLAAAAEGAGVRVAPDDTWSDIFSRLMAELVEPRIGDGRATLLAEYPSSEAALARANPVDPRVAERFELFACGVELANGFGELTDPEEQRRRFEADMAEKQRIYGERYPIDPDFIAALETMPEASGVALGFDRLVMLLTGADHIDRVQWTPVVDVE